MLLSEAGSATGRKCHNLGDPGNSWGPPPHGAVGLEGAGLSPSSQARIRTKQKTGGPEEQTIA